MISNEKDASNRLELAKQVLDPLRRDRLSLDVLVDLFSAVDDLDVPVVIHSHQIAAVEPALVIEGALVIGRIEVAHHHVRPPNQ